MTTLDASLAALSSPDLLAALERTAAKGREVTADLIALLGECDARKLYAAEGYASLFEFCVVRLRLSEAQAYHRIQAARASQRFPLVLERLRAGRVTLTAVALLRQQLTEDNHRGVLDWAEGRGKREVEMLVRRLDPKPDVPASIRRLATPCARPPVTAAAERQPSARAVEAPASAPLGIEPSAGAPLLLFAAPPVTAAASLDGARLPTFQGPTARTGSRLAGTSPPLPCAAPTRRAEIHPLAPARYSLHVTISEETHDKLRRAQDLLLHTLPAADPALVLDRALTLLVAQLERRKAGAPRKPKPAERLTPAVKPATPPTPQASGSKEPDSVGPGRMRGSAASPPSLPAVNAAAIMGRPAPPTLHSAGRRRDRSRYIPAAVRRAVWDRDGARCAYVSRSGVRCSATAALEYHHRVPFAEGGASTAENLALACVRHNAWEAKRWFNFDRAEFVEHPHLGAGVSAPSHQTP